MGSNIKRSFGSSPVFVNDANGNDGPLIGTTLKMNMLYNLPLPVLYIFIQPL